MRKWQWIPSPAITPMISAILILLISVQSVQAGTAFAVEDCTSGGMLTAEAVNCEDTYPDFCSSTQTKNPYLQVATYVVAKAGMKADTRINLCYSGDDIAAADLKREDAFVKAATLTCPKTCGFCCITPAYNCKEADNPKIKCESVTQEMCKDAKWRELIAESCPNKCGFCLLGGCIDAAVDCDKDHGICMRNDAETQAFVKENCKRTCGFCTGSNNNNNGTNPITGSCMDNHQNCPSWVHNGFCSSSTYTNEMKQQYCARSCNLCT